MMHTFDWRGPVDQETLVQEVFYIHYDGGLTGEVIISKTLENEDGHPVDKFGDLISPSQQRIEDMRIPADALLDFVGSRYVASRIGELVENSTGKELINLLIGA